MNYTVFIDDNFHYQDEDYRENHGSFKTAEKAVARCRKIVERSLRDLREPKQSAADLCALYVMFGDDPFIVAEVGVEPVRFSARDYATEYCEVLLDPQRQSPTALHDKVRLAWAGLLIVVGSLLATLLTFGMVGEIMNDDFFGMCVSAMVVIFGWQMIQSGRGML